MNQAIEQLQIGGYQVFGRAGSDYSGSSFLARQPETNEVVRIRLYRPEYRNDPAFANNFRKDVPRARKPGNDSYMAQPLASGYTQRIYPYVIFNQLLGKTWADLLAVRDLSNADMVELCVQAVRALAAAHTGGLVVGELTPQMLVVAHSSSGDEVRLAELALGRPRLLDLKHPAAENKLDIGSSALSEYSAPELATIGSEPTPTSDVYSMGALLWEMFTGMRFRDAWLNPPKSANGKSASGSDSGAAEAPTLKLPHNMPPQLSAFLQRALALNPARRFPDGNAMYDELAGMQARDRNQKSRSAPLTLNTRGEPSVWAMQSSSKVRRWLGPAAILATLIVLAVIYGGNAFSYIASLFPNSTPAANATPAAGAIIVGETLPTPVPTTAAATAPSPPTIANLATPATGSPPTATLAVAPSLVAPAADGVAAQYDLRLALDLTSLTIPVQQVISYTNQQTTTINELVFRVVPHHFDGSFTLERLTVNGQPAPYTWRDDVNLSVPLTGTGLTPLAPGASCVVAMQYTLRPLTASNRFAIDAANRIITLGDWLPTLTPYQYGNPVVAPYARVGDNGIGPPADYTVQVHTVQPMLIAASGQQVSRDGNDWSFHVNAGRDFALTASDQFLDPTADKSLTRTAKDGTVIYGYFLPAHRDHAARILDLTVAAYDWYSVRLGPRYARRFSVAEMADSLLPTVPLTTAVANDSGLRIAADQEYPDLYLLRAGGVRDEDINDGGFLWWRGLHGPAYQWLYADVATNQYSDPWLDEATANYATLYLIKDLYPASFNKAWADWGNYVPVAQANPNLRPTPSPDSYKPLGAAVNAFAGRDDYFTFIYRQGATFFDAIHTAMGDANFWKALTAYHKQFSGKTASGRDLLNVLQASAPTDLQPLFQQYVGYGSKLQTPPQRGRLGGGARRAAGIRPNPSPREGRC